MANDYGLNDDWWDGKTMFNSSPYSGISSDRDVDANKIHTVNDGIYYYVFRCFSLSLIFLNYSLKENIFVFFIICDISEMFLCFM